MEEDGRLKNKDRGRKTEDRRLKKVTFTLSFILVLLFSCQNVKKPEKPENLIPKEKMVNILSDLYISNAARNVNNKRIIKAGIQLDSLIYTKFEIDSLQFVESNAFYSSNLKVYGEMLTQVQEKLKFLQKEKDSLYKIAKREDSIQKAKTDSLNESVSKN